MSQSLTIKEMWEEATPLRTNTAIKDGTDGKHKEQEIELNLSRLWYLQILFWRED